MKYLRSGFTLLLLLVVLGWPTSSARAQDQRPVLVYYYAWWAPDTVGPGKSPDWPITPYHSWDPAVIQQHVSQIASAGIDGMVVAWYGPQEEYNQTETNFRMILDQASANGIYALLSVDLGNSAWFTSVQEVIDGLNYALSVHANHPAYFRYNGRPVLFFWYQGRYSLDDWAYIRQQVDPEHNSIWIAEGAAPDALPIFDGLHMYTISWSSNVYATLSQWGTTTHSRGGIWVATAMPGWDNTYTQQSERYIRERGDGAFYRETFAAAAASAPEMIVITSWNEWWEGTHIEPSYNYGDFYLNLTRQLISEYKSSGAVAGGSGAPPPVQPTAAPTTSGPDTEPPPAGGESTQPDATPITEEPTATLPPTETPIPTPTPTPTPTPIPLNLPTLQPTVEQAGESSPDAETGAEEGGGISYRLEAALANSLERTILIAGALSGLGGILLLGFAVLVLRRRVPPPDDREA
ncbi:MAG TPA: hypothetical protein ENI95_05430 [Chloroflexi bacterium]|nr:hypothetical protein [Chloroflexota bacterium]